MLTKHQIETLQNLEIYQNITKPKDIINWCLMKLKLPKKKRRTKNNYRQIIIYVKSQSFKTLFEEHRTKRRASF